VNRNLSILYIFIYTPDSHLIQLPQREDTTKITFRTQEHGY